MPDHNEDQEDQQNRKLLAEEASGFVELPPVWGSEADNDAVRAIMKQRLNDLAEEEGLMITVTSTNPDTGEETKETTTYEKLAELPPEEKKKRTDAIVGLVRDLIFKKQMEEDKPKLTPDMICESTRRFLSDLQGYSAEKFISLDIPDTSAFMEDWLAASKHPSPRCGYGEVLPPNPYLIDGNSIKGIRPYTDGEGTKALEQLKKLMWGALEPTSLPSYTIHTTTPSGNNDKNFAKKIGRGLIKPVFEFVPIDWETPDLKLEPDRGVFAETIGEVLSKDPSNSLAELTGISTAMAKAFIDIESADNCLPNNLGIYSLTIVGTGYKRLRPFSGSMRKKKRKKQKALIYLLRTTYYEAKGVYPTSVGEIKTNDNGTAMEVTLSFGASSIVKKKE